MDEVGTQLGTLSGTGEIRGPDGKVKGTFTLSAPCTEEEAKRAIEALLGDKANGNYPR